MVLTLYLCTNTIKYSEVLLSTQILPVIRTSLRGYKYLCAFYLTYKNSHLNISSERHMKSTFDGTLCQVVEPTYSQGGSYNPYQIYKS